MLFSMAIGLPGSSHIFTVRNFANRFRSLNDCDEVHHRVVYEHGKRNPHGGQADVHGAPLIFSMLKTRKIHLSAINAWLEGKREPDEYVIEALSKCQIVETFRIELY